MEQNTAQLVARYLKSLQEQHRFDLRKSRASFQTRHRKEIDRIASALKSDGVLSRIDSTRWHCSCEPTTLRIAEEIVSAFQVITACRHKDDGIRKAEQLRDVYRKVARILHKARAYDHVALMNKEAKWWEGHVKNLRSSVGYQIYRPTKTAIAEPVNRLTICLVAILAHSTDLKRNYMLTSVVPDLLEVAWKAYPDDAPSRGSEGPRTRYIRAMKKARGARTEAEQLYYFRLYLFAGDERFPESLFGPRHRARTVQHRVSPTLH